MPSIDLTSVQPREATYFMMPARDASSVSAGDTFNACRGLWVGTGGDLALQMAADFAGTGGEVATFKSVPGGTLLPFSAIRLLSAASGTTASDVVAVY